MANGNNRDYRTRDRRAWKNLARHAEIMKALDAEGMSRAEASDEAFRRMTERQRKANTAVEREGSDG